MAASSRRIILVATFSGLLMMLVVAGLLFLERSQGVSSQPLLLEIAPAAERTLYLGFTNTLLGIVLFSTTLSGVIVALFGFSALVALTIAAHLVGLAAAARMRETGRGLV